MLRIGFCGSGHFAALCLKQLSAGCKISWVITNTPRPAGRGMQLHKTEVNMAADELEIPCRTTDRLSADTESNEWIKSSSPDLIFVIDFGHMIKEPLLSLPKYGCINLHPSKLPRYRGSAPLQRSIMDGCSETAVSIFKLDKGMDSGELLAQPEVTIADDDTYETLLEKCVTVGCAEMLHLLNQVGAENWKFTRQTEEGASLAPKLEKAEGRLDWTKPAFCCNCLIRAIASSPGVFCFSGGKRIRVFKAEVIKSGSFALPGVITDIQNGFPTVACGENSLKLEVVQPEGKRQQSAADWLRGARLNIGDRLE